MILCPLCKSQNQDTATKCVLCGTSLSHNNTVINDLALSFFEIGLRREFTLTISSNDNPVILTEKDISNHFGCGKRSADIQTEFKYDNGMIHFANRSETCRSYVDNIITEKADLPSKCFIKFTDNKGIPVWAFRVIITADAVKKTVCAFCGRAEVIDNICGHCGRNQDQAAR